jgi:predicted dehydrogenase
MTYLVRLAGGASGTIQMSAAAWFGTGERLEVYGAEGMLMMTSLAGAQGWAKSGADGDPDKGGMRLYGARVDLQRYIADPVPPEHLQRRFAEIPPDHRPATTLAEGRSAFAVAEEWAAFHDAIVNDAPFAPSSVEAVKIHRIMDAAEAAQRERRWVEVRYGV